MVYLLAFKTAIYCPKLLFFNGKEDLGILLLLKVQHFNKELCHGRHEPYQNATPNLCSLYCFLQFLYSKSLLPESRLEQRTCLSCDAGCLRFGEIRFLRKWWVEPWRHE